MVCCQQCPFHPKAGFASERCQAPLCALPLNSQHLCIKMSVTRCFYDIYVVNRLYQNDQLARQLALTVLKKAVKNRDRALTLALFHAADAKMRNVFWQWLENTEPRSLWLLNPIFAAAGLLPLGSFAALGTRKGQYLSALSANPYSGNRYQADCLHIQSQ